MRRGPYTIEEARYSVELRTMLAYPYGTNAWLTNCYVLKDIIDVYPEVWNAVPAPIKHTSHRFPPRRSHDAESGYMVPLTLFNLLLRVGRQEISPLVAIRWLRAHFRQTPATQNR